MESARNLKQEIRDVSTTIDDLASRRRSHQECAAKRLRTDRAKEARSARNRSTHLEKSHMAALNDRLLVLGDLVTQNRCIVKNIDTVRKMIAFEVPNSIRPLTVASFSSC